MIYSLYVLNKSGGVIFKQDSEHGRAHDDANDSLRMGSLFYSFNSHSENFAPVAPPGQITAMETDCFSLRCIYTDSGMLFLTSFHFPSPKDGKESISDELFQRYYIFCPWRPP